MIKDEWAEDTSHTGGEGEQGIIPTFDVAALADDLVQTAVQSAVRKRVEAIAARAVEEALADEGLSASLEEQARVAIGEQLHPPATPPPDDGPPELHFGSIDQFVRGFLRHTYSRRINSRTERVWAPDWWRYAEAVSRLESLWRAWEALRLDPATGMSVWWRDHADHQMSVLFDPEGPFAGVDSTCAAGEPLPCLEPPPALFPDVRTPTS